MASQRAERIAVDFRGFYDVDTYGDWRACIVAVGRHGRARYSPLWNRGTMGMKIEPGDRRFWPTVAATPWALPRVGGGRGIGILLSGRHAYRYPYQVRLSGCRPGTPHNMPGDTDDYALTHLGQHRDRTGGGLCMIPHPGDTPVAETIRKTLRPLWARLDQFKKETERLIADGKISTGNWWYYRRFAPNLSFLDECVDGMLDGVEGRRHPNGGGWVAASAEVAETAYVAPNAMVLDGAKVLDRAAVEEFAVVRGPSAVVSGQAKVSGQAYVAGNVKIDGYSRVLHPIVGGQQQVVANEVTLRQFQEPEEGGKLWANYACDRFETEVLEDWFRYKHPSRPRRFYLLNLNGHLHGRPEFVVDGPRRGFRFDGRTQYAEASPILADLGRITINLALRWEGGASQAVFDFGTSTDNRFVLLAAGESGKAELVVAVDGKTDRFVADTALPKDKWTQCRVEIDGQTIALWIDGCKVASRRSVFRPADVDPPGVERRNFIATSRDGTARFPGILDYLCVYHAVFDDLARQPAPRQHSSRRVSLAFVDACREEYAGADLCEALIDAKTRQEYAYYEQIARKRDERIRHLRIKSRAKRQELLGETDFAS